jgi:hypothetical protein
VEEVAGEFFEILDLADLVHLIDDSIDDGLDFFVGFLLEERALAFQPRFVPQELLFVNEAMCLFLLSVVIAMKGGIYLSVSQPASLFFSTSFTVCGFARPAVAFIT